MKFNFNKTLTIQDFKAKPVPYRHINLQSIGGA